MCTLIQYSENFSSDTVKFQSFSEAWEQKNPEAINWYNLINKKGEEFEIMCRTLELHPLMVEDMQSKSQMPKFELFGHVSFMSVQMLQWVPLRGENIAEQVSMIIGKNFIITVQDDKESDVFDPVRNKIKNNYKRVAKNGIDYLFISLIDVIVDEYNLSIQRFRQPLEDIEVTMLKRPNVNLMPKIMEYKTELNRLRKFIAPLKDELQRIKIENPELIGKSTNPLFRDVIDHHYSLIANFDSFREILRDLTDLHHSNQNLMLNNTMKTLTVISAIFIPLTFIVGVYGMNFKYFPELEWRYGYLFIWLVMIGISAGLIVYMKRKRWF